MSSHTVPCKKNFWMFKEYSNKLSDIKLVCSSCPFEASVSDSDDMAKHLYQNKFHVCHIVSKSSASSIIDNIVQRSEQISTLDEIKTEANPSSALLATETLEVDLTADGNQEKTDQPLLYKAENPSVEAVPSPKGDKLSDQQDKTNSNNNVESNQSTENTADGPLSELMTEKDYDAGERVQDNSSNQALTPSDTNEAQDLKSEDNDVEIVQDEFVGIDTCDEPKDCKTLPDLILKCKQTGNEGIDNEKCTEEKSNDANVEQNKDPKEDVCFDQFFRSKDEPEAVGSDVSEQGSIQLEPLTPSEVLEHEATEILQKGSVVTVTKRKGTASTEENNKETTPAPILLSSEHLEENEKS